MAQTANRYTAQHAGTTSTGTILSAVLSFNANLVRIVNDGTVPLRVTVSSSAASTSDDELRPGETVEYAATTDRVGIMTTSTSTDDDHRRFRLVAVGG